MKTIKAFLYTACFIMAMVGAWNLFNMNRSTARTTELYDALAEARTAVETTEATVPSDVAAGYRPIVNPWLLELESQNKELAGWLTVEGTNIDYPVMQTREDNDFYLEHDFSKRKDAHGTPFLDTKCRVQASENLIIYGHFMKDYTMFQNLSKFREPGFCESYGGMKLETVEGSREYRVAIVMVISSKETEDFPYYEMVNLSREEDYRYFLDGCSKYAIWQAETLPEPGTGLLTLSTCEYTKQNGRLVVIGAEIE